jgi:streptogramin lyase
MTKQLARVSLAALGLFLAACGGTPNSPATTTGTLQINVSGLPAGVLAAVTTSGPAGFTDSATATHTVAPGTYTVTAADVVSGSTYVATITGSPATISAGDTATVNVVYAVPATTGTLQINVSGLPAGALASVTTSGPSGFTDTATATHTVQPGTYTVTAANVVSGSTTYSATITGSPAAVTAGVTKTVGVVYTAVIATNGIANVVITFPGGVASAGTIFFRNVSITESNGSLILTAYDSNTSLQPGNYSVAATPVTISSIVYTPTVATQPFSITAGNTTVINVDYEFPKPTITAVTQNYVLNSTQFLVGIAGTGFASDGHTFASIDGAPCTGVTITNATSLQCTVPTPHAPGFVSVTVTTTEGTTAVSPAFQYEYWSVDFYSLGEAAGDLATDGSMTVGPDGNIWFCDRSFGKIGTVDNLGNITECTLPADSSPVDIVAGADGNLWFTDFDFATVNSLSPTGFAAGACTITAHSVLIPATPKAVPGHPFGITSGPDGNIWFVNDSSLNGTFDQIGKVDLSNGDAITQFPLGTQGSAVFGITSGAGDLLWFGQDANNVLGTITTGGTVALVPDHNGGNWLTLGPDGNIWYTSSDGVSGTVGMITPGGVATLEANADVGLGGRIIVSDPRGAIWYSETDGLARFDTTLLKQRVYPAASGSGLAVAPNGDLWAFCIAPPAKGQSAGVNSICRLHF